MKIKLLSGWSCGGLLIYKFFKYFCLTKHKEDSVIKYLLQNIKMDGERYSVCGIAKSI